MLLFQNLHIRLILYAIKHHLLILCYSRAYLLSLILTLRGILYRALILHVCCSINNKVLSTSIVLMVCCFIDRRRDDSDILTFIACLFDIIMSHEVYGGPIIYKKPSYRWGTARRGRASWNLVKFCTNVDDLYLKSSETRLLPIRL